MRSSLFVLGIAFVACSSADKKPPTADPPTELVACNACGGPVRLPLINEGVAQGVTIAEVAAFQTLKVPLMKNGTAIDAVPPPKWGHVRYAGKRDGVLRIYLQTEPGWQARPLVAQLRLVTIMPSGFLVRTITSKPYTPKKAPADGDLESTLNIDLPGAIALPDTNYSITITDPAQGKGPQPMDNARWPRDGSLTPFHAQPSLDKVRVKLVPMDYQGKIPDTSPGTVETYRKVFYGMYAAAVIDISVRDPYPYTGVMDGSIGSWSKLLDETGKIRNMDNAEPDVYYYSIIPTSGGGGIAGLSGVGTPWSTGINNPATAAHEIGHAHGLQHAPCGGAALGSDMGGPYPDASIGVWGFDQNTRTLIDPSSKVKDFMSYCNPEWISDYHYNQFFDRVQSDNRLAADMRPVDGRAPRTLPRVFVAHASPDGLLEIDDLPQTVVAERGEPRSIDVGGANETGWFVPYDHAPGGFYLVPESVKLASKWRVVRAM